MGEYPKHFEGVTGTLRDEDDLLSLSDQALKRRRMMMDLAYVLYSATMVGDPAPKVADMYRRISNPVPGDLVLETSSFRRGEMKAFGILLAKRDEYWHTDEQWEEDLADGAYYASDTRPTEDIWYVQYGPNPDDICRWHNCSFIMVPTEWNFRQ